jgi:uncharacterized phage-associated protein
MHSALDVAEYILERLGETETVKLQKLVYYSQAWSLAWTGEPLFAQKIEAWRLGPVVPELYQMHAGQNAAVSVRGRSERLELRQRALIDEVLRYYDCFDGRVLSKMTHREDPWKDARGDLPENMYGTAEIPHEAMRRFYAGRPCGNGQPVTDLSALSRDRVEQSRREIDAGEFVDIAGLAHAG